MTGMFRRFAAALAIFATVLTAGAVGTARGQAAAAGEMVICAGAGIVTILVDAEGKPTGRPHWCPDCVLSLLAGLAPARVLPEMPSGVTAAPMCPVAAAAAGLDLSAPRARGPPGA